MIPLPQRLEQMLAETRDPARRAELLAEQACYFARTGEFADARRIADDLRAQFGDGRDPRVSVWRMLLEGVTLYYEKLSVAARDRVFRAKAVAEFSGVDDLVGLTGAWLAHVDFSRARFAKAVELAGAAIRTAAPDAHATHIRGAMVIANGFQWIGEFERAKPWYESVHQHAVASGDQVAIGALMYNRAAFAISYLRTESHAGMAPEESYSETQLKSAMSFKAGIGASFLSHLTLISSARIAIYKGRYEEAVEVLQSIEDELPSTEDRLNKSEIDGDLAWSLFKLGKNEDALKLVADINEATTSVRDSDDRFVALSISLAVRSAIEPSKDHTSLAVACHEAREQYLSDVAEVKAIFADSKFPNLHES